MYSSKIYILLWTTSTLLYFTNMVQAGVTGSRSSVSAMADATATSSVGVEYDLSDNDLLVPEYCVMGKILSLVSYLGMKRPVFMDGSNGKSVEVSQTASATATATASANSNSGSTVVTNPIPPTGNNPGSNNPGTTNPGNTGNTSGTDIAQTGLVNVAVDCSNIAIAASNPKCTPGQTNIDQTGLVNAALSNDSLGIVNPVS